GGAVAHPPSPSSSLQVLGAAGGTSAQPPPLSRSTRTRAIRVVRPGYRACGRCRPANPAGRRRRGWHVLRGARKGLKAPPSRRKGRHGLLQTGHGGDVVCSAPAIPHSPSARGPFASEGGENR